LIQCLPVLMTTELLPIHIIHTHQHQHQDHQALRALQVLPEKPVLKDLEVFLVQKENKGLLGLILLLAPLDLLGHRDLQVLLVLKDLLAPAVLKVFQEIKAIMVNQVLQDQKVNQEMSDL